MPASEQDASSGAGGDPWTTLDNVWIPLRDGTRLAARIWLPRGAEASPEPALLEYLPYRKNDLSAETDARTYRYLAEHGYAGVRVDIRGTGDSDGVFTDEYTHQEQDDALEVIAWIAEQPWCSGAVGMLGISYGGFNSLQVAARRPPALRAIISAGSVDDRFGQDVHRIGGCVHDDGLVWAAYAFSFAALPPDPVVSAEGWREQWRARLEALEPPLHTWLAHQRRDEYWRHGSVCEHYGAIDCAVYMVSGWADRYRDSVLTFLASYAGPCKGLIGPWEHSWPQLAAVGPSVGFLQEAVRWFDHWLKGIDTGIMREPKLQVWLQQSEPPQPGFHERAGRWAAETSWPSPAVEERLLYPQDEGLLERSPEREELLEVRASLRAGTASGVSCPFRIPSADLPLDQRTDDALSLSFTTPPLEEPLVILGAPEVAVALSADAERALLAARVCDVAPDGRSALITRGILNLTHRESSAEPSALAPGQPVVAKLRLMAVGYEVAARHRLRLALSPAYWPWVWPSPSMTTLAVRTGRATRLSLPVRRAREDEPAPVAFGPPEAGRPLEVEVLRGDESRRIWSYDVGGRRLERRSEERPRAFRTAEGGVLLDVSFLDVASVHDDDPLSAAIETSACHRVGRGESVARIEAWTRVTCDARQFHLASALHVFEGEEPFFVRTWTKHVERDLV